MKEWKNIKIFIQTSTQKKLDNDRIIQIVYNSGLFTNFTLLLNFYMTIPIVNVTVEGGVSLLNNIKDDLRNRMSNELLNDLMIIFLHGPQPDFLQEDDLNEAIYIWKEKKKRYFYFEG